MQTRHHRIALQLGMTEAQMGHLMSIVEVNIAVKEAEAGRLVLAEGQGK